MNEGDLIGNMANMGGVGVIAAVLWHIAKLFIGAHATQVQINQDAANKRIEALEQHAKSCEEERKAAAKEWAEERRALGKELVDAWRRAPARDLSELPDVVRGRPSAGAGTG